MCVCVCGGWGGGSENAHKIPWVKWDEVCKEKASFGDKKLGYFQSGSFGEMSMEIFE